MACAAIKRLSDLDYASDLEATLPLKRPRLENPISGHPPLATNKLLESSAQHNSTMGFINNQQKTTNFINMTNNFEFTPSAATTSPSKVHHHHHHQAKVAAANSSIPVSPQRAAEDEKGLFTFEQLKKICLSTLNKREKELTDEYEEILKSRLAEQYDTFIKFTHDHILRDSQKNSTYLS